jgi:hypothetical protein
MASLSSLFIGQQPQQQPQAAAVTTQELPKQIAPYYEKLLKEAEALYKQKMEAGAPIYEGKTMAGFTPEQEQLFTGLQGLQGTQAPKFAEAEALTRGTAARVTPDEVQEYMNPYQQAVVDIEKREAEKQYQSTVVPQLAAQAAAAGSFGGSRQGILEGMASEANQRLQADIQAKGSAQAYKDAMANINQQRQREGAAAGQLAQLAPAGFAAQAQELGAIGKVGDAKQQQQQLALDEAYKQYMQEQQFPSESLKEYQSYVQSFPNIPTQITRAPQPQQPGIAQSLLGLGTTALGTYGSFGGFSPGGFMGMKQAETGGGISGLPVVRAQKSAYLEGQLQNIEKRKAEALARREASKKNIGNFFGDIGDYLGNLGKRKKEALDKFNTKVEDFQTGASEAYGKPFNELSQDELSLYRNTLSTTPTDNKELASVVPDSAGAGEFGTGEYTGPTKEDLGLGTDTTQSTSNQNNQGGLADIESNISNVPTEEEYQARLQQQKGAPPPSTTVETPSTIDAQVKALMGTSTAASDARTDLNTLYSKQLGKYEMPKDVEEGFEKVRGGTETDIADVETDITESKQATKNELFTPLIDMGAAIASGKTTISAALTEAAKKAVGIQKEGKARTRALKKEKRKLEKELDRFDLNLAQYTEEKVTKRDQDIFNRAKDKFAMGLELTKLEEKTKDRYINAWKAVTSNIVAKRNAEANMKVADAKKYAAKNPTTKPGYDSPTGKDLEVATNYVTGAVKVLKNDDKLLNNISGILSKSFGRDVTSNDTKATLDKIIQDPLFINNYEEYHQANVKANKDTTPIRREDTLNAFLPFYLQGRKDLFTRDRAYIPLDKTLGL